MNSRLILPLAAMAVVAVAPGCRSRKAYTPPAPATAYAPAPVYTAPAPDPALRADLGRVNDKVDGLGAQLADLRSKLDTMGTQPAPMVMPPPTPLTAPEPVVASGDGEANRFLDTLRSRGVQASQRGSTVVVRLSDAFKAGSDNLKGDVALAKTLQAVAEGLQVAPGARVQVIGHSDMTPIKKSPWPDNTALSRARAQTVARVLSENGVRAYIDVDGRGESEPLVSPEKSKADQSKNRRVDIQVTFG